MPERFSLGAVIRQRRLELGWTQEELAERISTDGEYVRQSEISRIENGRVELPRHERLLRLAEVLDLPAGELLARSGWVGAAELLRDGGNSMTPVHPSQPVNGDAGAPKAKALNSPTTENLRRALASLHEQTDRLNRNRERAAEILDQVQRPRPEQSVRRFHY
jgi:transcriptional regulator with XRE-family HTH domain